MYWANLFHIYQPPGQKKEITRKVANESYSPIIEILKNRPEAKINLNFNAWRLSFFPAGIFPDV